MLYRCPIPPLPIFRVTYHAVDGAWVERAACGLVEGGTGRTSSIRRKQHSAVAILDSRAAGHRAVRVVGPVGDGAVLKARLGVARVVGASESGTRSASVGGLDEDGAGGVRCASCARRVARRVLNPVADLYSESNVKGCNRPKRVAPVYCHVINVIKQNIPIRVTPSYCALF